MFNQVIEWCKEPQNNFRYEQGHDYCDCVDYTDFLNVYLKDGYRFTIYYYPTTNSYALRLYEHKDLIVLVENIDSLNDLKKILEEYDLL